MRKKLFKSEKPSLKIQWTVEMTWAAKMAVNGRFSWAS